jgi:hypothetical protein
MRYRLRDTMKKALFVLSLAVFCAPVLSQTKADYGSSSGGDSSKVFGLFGMLSGGGSSSIQSQSFYSTMLQYRFAAPVTLNLNFGLPIHSTFSPYQNLTGENMQSLNYFKNIPFDVSLTWQPSERFFFNFSIVNYPSYYGYGYDMFDVGPMTRSRK